MNKVILIIIVLICILVTLTYSSDVIEKFGDAFNNQLNQDVIEKPSDFDYKYDKQAGILLSNSTPRDDLKGTYNGPEDDEIPIKVIQPNSYLLDDGNDGKTGLHTNMCSKLCCSAQYPLPFKLGKDERLCNSDNNFVPSSYMCNNAWQDSGCLCMTKEQSEALANRYGNAA